jgi:acetyl esterase
MNNKLLENSYIDPRIRAMLGQANMPVLPDVESREALLAMMAAARECSGDKALDSAVPEEMYEAVAPSTGLSIRTKMITSTPDGNAIKLQIIRPDNSELLPCVYYIHGGGMMFGSCFDANFRAWGRMIASHGVAVVMVDFRNAVEPSSAPEIAPFPAGLNDCVSGLKWLSEHAQKFDIDPTRIIVAGESGGGNLAVATLLKLKREGNPGLVKGLYAMCPYLAGEWSDDKNSSAMRNRNILMDVYSISLARFCYRSRCRRVSANDHLGQ